jgi:two-component system, OmpR family, sensor histidine kinase VicK
MSFNIEELDRKKGEVVQIIYGAEEASSAALYCISSANETIDLYAEGIGVYTMFHYPETLKRHKEALSRGIRIRVITEITKDNLPSVKEGLQYVSDVRHMDTITHYFGISEKHYLSSKLQYGDPSLSQSIFSNIGWFVREQQYLFETLWKKAIPLKQRIREIEEGHKR